jgi:hypothetical protein
VTGISHGLIPNIGADISKAAAAAVLDAIKSAVLDAANWLVGHVIDLGLKSTAPDLSGYWFRKELALMESELLLVVLPLVVAATIGPVLRQDLGRLFRIWGVGFPVAVLAGLGGVQFVGIALNATDGLCALFLGAQSHAIAVQFSDAMGSAMVAQAPTFVQIIVGVLAITGSVLVWLELMVRSAAVYIATFFMPLALASYVWPSTARIAKRSIEILVAVVLSKLVIVASLSLGLAALGSGSGVDAMVSGAGILLLAGFAPFTLFRMAPIIEASAVAHLEGLSRRPFRAAGAAATAAAAAPAHPVARLITSSMSASAADPSPPVPVAPQPIPEHPADWPFARSGAGGD